MLELLARCVCGFIVVCLVIFARVMLSGAAKDMESSKPEDGEVGKGWDIGKRRRLKQLRVQLVIDVLFLVGSVCIAVYCLIKLTYRRTMDEILWARGWQDEYVYTLFACLLICAYTAVVLGQLIRQQRAVQSMPDEAH